MVCMQGRSIVINILINVPVQRAVCPNEQCDLISPLQAKYELNHGRIGEADKCSNYSSTMCIISTSLSLGMGPVLIIFAIGLPYLIIT